MSADGAAAGEGSAGALARFWEPDFGTTNGTKVTKGTGRRCAGAVVFRVVGLGGGAGWPQRSGEAEVVR